MPLSTHSSRALALAVLYVASSAHIGHCFGHSDEGSPPAVAPEVHGHVLELPGGRLEASIDVVHPSSGASLATAELALLENGGELTRAEADLLEVDGYNPKATYTLAFSLDARDAETANVPVGPYELSKHGPLERPSAWWHDQHTVAWDPAGLTGYVEVRDDTGRVRWSNDVPRRGGRQAIPAEALEVAAVVLVCGVEVLRANEAPTPTPAHALADDHIEGRLGHRSTLTVGRCHALEP